MVNFVNISFGESMKLLKKELDKLSVVKAKSSVNKSDSINQSQSQAYQSSILVDYEVDESEIEDDDHENFDDDLDYRDLLNSDSNTTAKSVSQRDKRQNKPANSLRKINAEKWDENQVATWLTQEHVHASIFNAFHKLNGHTLKEMYNIKLENPQYFHQSLIEETNNEAKLSDLAYFISKLKKLFDDNST